MGYPYQGMTPEEYQREVLRTERTPLFVDAPDKQASAEFSRLIHGMVGVCTEAGELQDMVKKHLIYGKPFDRTNVLEECGDTLWYLVLSLDACGFTLEECMQRNIAKLRARYPQGFTADKALNRDIETERLKLEEGWRCAHGNVDCGICK